MKKNLTFYPKLVFRTPLLGQKFSLSIAEINHYLKEELVQEAIFLASPDFYNAIQKYLNNELTTTKEIRRVRTTAYKYLIRMMNRPTPFGLFAACSVAKWDPTTNISLPLPEQIIRKPRLEVTFLATLMEDITSMPSAQKTLTYQLNDTIYSLGKKITYIKLHDINGHKKPAIEVAKLDDYLALVLKETEKKAKLADLSNKLKHLDNTLTEEDITGYLEELINAQILINEWIPNVTGTSYYQRILTAIDKSEKNKNANFLPNHFIETFKKIQTLLLKITNSENNPTAYYQQLYKTIQTQPNTLPGNKSVHLDAYKKGESDFLLTNSIQENLLEAVKFLTYFRPASPQKHLTIFKQKFKLRYDKQEVPLLELMDASIGLGYPIQANTNNNFLLVNIPNHSKTKSTKEQWNATTKLLHQLLVDAQKNQQYQTDLETYIDFETLPLPNNMPPSKSLVFTIEGTENQIPQILIKYLGASSGTNLLNRFAHGHAEIAKIVKDLGQYESNQFGKEIILAEVVHFTEYGAGNLLCRPAIRQYEIPYLCQSGVPQDQQIPLDDLTVSLVNNQWVIRSKKLNKVVVLRLSNSHDYSKNIHPIYRFLGDLQYQARESSRLFSWGLLQPLFQFFPRLYFKNIILSRACWRLTKDQYPSQDIAFIASWRAQWNIPKYIAYGSWGQELIYDLTNSTAVELFIEKIKQQEEILFYEVIFDPKTCPVKDAKGSPYTNEFITTLLNKSSPKASAPSFDIFKNKEGNNFPESSFLPGSNWVYFKIYSSTAAANAFLLDYLYPFIQHLFHNKIIVNCFFIRYKDEFDHLRIRVLLKDPKQLGAFMRTLHQLVQQAKEEKLIWKYQLDTYEREIERYGAISMILSESIFSTDTMNLFQVLHLIKKNRDPNLYWQFGILAIDQYLAYFPLIDRKRLAGALIKRLGKKFNLNQKEILLKLNKQYRTIRPSLFQLFDQKHPNSHMLNPLISQRKIQFEPYFNELKQIYSDNFSLIENNALNTLITSYIHLTINRLYSDQQPYNEFVLYYFLEKHYTSWIALNRKD